MLARSKSLDWDLEQLLYDFVADDANLSSAAARQLEQLGQESIRVFALVAQNQDYAKHIRLQAIRSLGRIGGQAASCLVELLDDPESAIRVSVITAIERLGATAFESTPNLIDALSDDVADVRAAAASALGKIGQAAKDAVPYLAIAKQDHVWSVAWAATQAINRIDGNYNIEDAIPSFLAIVQDKHEPLYRRFAVLSLLDGLTTNYPEVFDTLNTAYATWASPFNQRKFAIIMEGIKFWEPRYDHNLALVASNDRKIHPIRESAWLAQLYFQSGTNIFRANQLIRSVIKAQALNGYRSGNFKWNYEDNGVEDQNAVTFILPSLLYIYSQHYHQLEPDLQDQIEVVLERGHQAILDLEKHIPVWYANVYLEMISCLIKLGDEDTALRWTNIFYNFTKQYGINEYASWGYVGVQLAGLQGAYENARTSELKRMLSELLDLHWFDVVHQMHPSTLMFSPASSRAKGSSGLKVNDTAKTLFYLYFGIGNAEAIEQPRVELLLTDYQPSDSVQAIIDAKLAGKEMEYQAKYGRVDAHVYQTSEYSLATQSGRRSSLGVINTSKTLLSSEEHETSIQLLVENDGDYQGSIFKVNDQRGDFDRHWITSVQKDNKAIVSYNFDPKGSVRNQIYSYAILGLITSIDEIQINGSTWNQVDTALSCQDVVALRINETYIGIRFLDTDVISIKNHSVVSVDKPILLAREGKEVVLYNYLAYDRSNMTFSQQDRRLGYVIKMASGEDFTSLSSFSHYLAALVITQKLDGSIHRVTAEIDGVQLYIEEDLARNIMLTRSVNEKEYDTSYLLKSSYVSYSIEHSLADQIVDETGSLSFPKYSSACNKHYISLNLSDMVTTLVSNRRSSMYGVNLGSTDLWRVWFRVEWTSKDTNSMDLRLNTDNVGFVRECITSDVIGSKHWVSSSDYLLHQGTHVITISRLAAGAVISEIMITNDLDFIPGGI